MSGGLIALALFAALWVFAAWLLWRAWRDRTGPRLSGMDGPAWLLAVAVGALPDDRRAWGVAMTAELAQVSGRAERWRFAAGCARTATFSPVRRLAPDLAVAGTGLAGVAGCVAVTAYMLTNHPSAADTLGPAAAVLLAAAVLAAALWLVLAPPPALTTSRHARRIGAGAAVAIGVGLVAMSRLALRDDGSVEGGVLGYVFVAPVVILFAGSAIAAAVDRSFRAGVEAALWSALLGSLAMFAIGLAEALHWHRIDGRLILDGESGYTVGQNLADFMWGLFLLPSWWLPFGVIGAAAGSAARGRHQGSPVVTVPGPRSDDHTVSH